MRNQYKTRFGIEFIRCHKCNFIHETFTGDFRIEIEAIEHAEDIHADNARRCKNSRLVIEVKKYFVQIETKTKEKQ